MKYPFPLVVDSIKHLVHFKMNWWPHAYWILEWYLLCEMKADITLWPAMVLPWGDLTKYSNVRDMSKKGRVVRYSLLLLVPVLLAPLRVAPYAVPPFIPWLLLPCLILSCSAVIARPPSRCTFTVTHFFYPCYTFPGHMLSYVLTAFCVLVHNANNIVRLSAGTRCAYKYYSIDLPQIMAHDACINTVRLCYHIYQHTHHPRANIVYTFELCITLTISHVFCLPH